MPPAAAGEVLEEEEECEEWAEAANTKLPSLHALLIGYDTLLHLGNMCVQLLLPDLLCSAQPQLRW